jgi:hypothetical protein
MPAFIRTPHLAFQVIDAGRSLDGSWTLPKVRPRVASPIVVVQRWFRSRALRRCDARSPVSALDSCESRVSASCETSTTASICVPTIAMVTSAWSTGYATAQPDDDAPVAPNSDPRLSSGHGTAAPNPPNRDHPVRPIGTRQAQPRIPVWCAQPRTAIEWVGFHGAAKRRCCVLTSYQQSLSAHGQTTIRSGSTHAGCSVNILPDQRAARALAEHGEERPS